ncbi:MAG: RnfH family protein [Xanthomonadales bacterium]|jgi:putative ubiquitin-RnfH superfamily antitoxin RatB of RatAB toxin-antitoxin module|nr:RnfH family protein [Xanthomonadales bacterium]
MSDTKPPRAGSLSIDVAFAWPDRQCIETVQLSAGATVIEAIEASGILAIIHEREPEYEIRPDRVGVFSRRVRLEDELRDGDRVELYRPLQADPREARRARVEADRMKEDRGRAGRKP